MDFNKYCRECGSVVEKTSNAKVFWCPKCEKEKVGCKDTIAGHTKQARVNQLKAMHELMCEANDEEIYITWIYLVPDCPSEEDFDYIAMDDSLYNEVFDLFVKLIAKNGNRY